MFEVIEVGPVTSKKGWFRTRHYFAAKMRALSPIVIQKLNRTFEGYGNYSTQTYQADFGEGAVITIWFPNDRLLAVGDKVSAESLAGEGYLNHYFRMVGTKY